jgi:predicted TPR repeat methyltransferase
MLIKSRKIDDTYSRRRKMLTFCSEEPQGKTSFERRRYRRYDNIKTDLREIECEGVDMMQVTQGTVHEKQRNFIS